MRPLKTILSVLATVAAIMTMATACSTDDAVDANLSSPTPSPTLEGVGGVVITVGAGFSEGQAQTRSTVIDEGGNRTLLFTEGDRLYIYGVLPENYYISGTLNIVVSTITVNGKSAKFSGKFNVYDPSGDDVTSTYEFTDPTNPLSDCSTVTANLLHRDMKPGVYTTLSNKTLSYNAAAAFAPDVETLMTTALEVKGTYSGSTNSFTLRSSLAILNCTLSGLGLSSNHKVRLNVDGNSVATYDFTTDASGMGTIAFVTSSTGSHSRTLDILQGDGSTLVGTIDLGMRDFTAKVYNVLRYWKDAGFSQPVNLAGYTSYTATNGEILTGKLGGGAQSTGNLTIADGATVVLHNVDITNVNTSYAQPLAGIDCSGDATIVLSGTTDVKNGAANKPAIFIPADKTLTIRGSGSLTASSNGYGAGIGGGHTMAHAGGNIDIQGGTIVANSTGMGAAIGSGQGSICGTITISGGTVTASSSHATQSPAAIGSGHNTANCGLITISGGTVTATSTGVGAGIGSGKSSDCYGISITGGTVTAEGTYGAGIGSGSDTGTLCGDITITNAVKKVTARKSGSECSIGKGYGASCGKVTIGGTLYYNGLSYENDGDTYLTQNELVYE